MAPLANPKLWRAISTVLLVAGIVGLILGHAWGWIALILSGVTFGVEYGLIFVQRSRTRRGPPAAR